MGELLPEFDFVKYSGKVPKLKEIPNSTIISIDESKNHLVEEKGNFIQRLIGVKKQRLEEVVSKITLVELNIVNTGEKALFSIEPYFFHINPHPQDNIYNIGDIVKDGSKIIDGTIKDENFHSLGFIQTPSEIPNAAYPSTSFKEYYSRNRNNDLTVKLFGYRKDDKLAMIGYRTYKENGELYSLVICTIDRFPNDPITAHVYSYNWRDLKGVKGFKMSRGGKRIFMIGKDENKKEFYNVLKLNWSERWMLNAPQSFIDRKKYYEKRKSD